jgi:hypothetical protein
MGTNARLSVRTPEIRTHTLHNVEVAELIQSQLANIQPFPSASPLYAEVARRPLSSWPSNVRTLTSMGTIPSTMTDTLHCTIDTSSGRGRKEDIIILDSSGGIHICNSTSTCSEHR